MGVQRFKRGQIWWRKEDLSNYNDDSVQKGARPVIIISNDAANKFSNSVTVVPCTTQRKTNLPTHVSLLINQPSTALAEQITTISTDKLTTYIGVCDDKLINEVNESIKVALGLKEIENVKEFEKENEITEETTINKEEKEPENTKSKRGRKPTYTEEYKIRYLNDYENHDKEYMMKKYKITNERTVTDRAYIFRKSIKGE